MNNENEKVLRGNDHQFALCARRSFLGVLARYITGTDTLGGIDMTTQDFNDRPKELSAMTESDQSMELFNQEYERLLEAVTADQDAARGWYN